MTTPTTRAEVIARRTYNRPLDTQGATFETWGETIARVISHQTWLWERAKGGPLSAEECAELEELRELMNSRKVLPSGRTLWLGGTEIAKRREASQFNCSFARIETVHDIVDAMWLLLQGCGVGFEPVVGTLNGFSRPVRVEVVRSENRTTKGREENLETFTEEHGEKVWTISLGDSAEAWAKAAGKLLANKRPVDVLRLDFREIRAPGIRLSGYGWISSGDVTISKAFVAIAEILNRRAGQLLSRIDILDIVNWLGTTLSSRRSAEIAVVPFDDREWQEFATAKKDHWIGNPQRAQSNNSLLFYRKPAKNELRQIFDLMQDAGGSEPGFINAVAALKRAPWFKGVNPCAEILLGNKSFCNLVETDLGAFNGNLAGLHRAIRLVARANYRQTCVSFLDGILQRSWHELNEFLRLCGVGLTGIVRWEHRDDGAAFRELRRIAHEGANGMADELGLPRPKVVTTVKPSGTLSKVMDTTEGVHKPLGRFIFNNVRFSTHDPLVPVLEQAGYRVFPDPYAGDAVLVTFPVDYSDVAFDECTVLREGELVKVEVNTESAIEQLERYKLLMDNYVDHNCSITVSYSPDEVEDIIDWIDRNWDSYVGVSFIYRNDPTKNAKDLGYPYLPQEVVTEEVFRSYVSGLRPVDINQGNSFEELSEDGCASGACPVR
ncbi:putative ribonucleoside triphosphate reductase [Azorhizobium caulinodans ORS 571]|uniref:Adenosylcobalamin-dependent ribonucleoside-triphosphate reductase n=1 Tax=Azorhizobium caulinodans (strain ATCC 43989 / DSM 5975 / JCM 20966 / LMG 6465 / NBRC 14845 / NCIMB 13405 / ORS 571) TaxID=438753 RepID=A8IF82_AZOC5|nr:ribonucleoside-triphosphate reductase, adenosylcobalamin-dependent [Azorhizobium caulinodans]BAF89587.1 putative ribonucleoside triphosphate reductase [Azorhizobium caulinodans ORS 571]